MALPQIVCLGVAGPWLEAAVAGAVAAGRLDLVVTWAPGRPAGPEPASRRLPLAGQRGFDGAQRWHVPDLEVATVTGAGVAADGLVIVACLPARVPAATLAVTGRLGWINLHPSLLPRHRGPDPGFWIAHAGDEATGLTVHRMTPGWDDGPILQQAGVRLGGLATLASRDAALQRLAPALVAAAIAQLVAGEVGRPQAAAAATYESFPRPADMRIAAASLPAWPLRRLVRFIHTVVVSRGPVLVEVDGGGWLRVVAAKAAPTGQRLRPGEAVAVGPSRWRFGLIDADVMLVAEADEAQRLD